MTQQIENTSYRTVLLTMTDGQLLTIPWPTGFVAGSVSVNANSSTVAGLVHARAGGSPLTVAMAPPLSNLTITTTDLTLSPPASGTGKLTVGRSLAGFQVHVGAAFTVVVTFLG
jgi:hypothetical protein